jgi:hypothetical protein
MIESVNAWVLRATDVALGWMLCLPSDAVLCLVALMTSLTLVLARKWTTDQEWLKRARDDHARLAALIRMARREKDAEALRRHRQTAAQIRMRGMRYEGRPLLWALAPILLLATWCFGRLEFLPPGAGEALTLRAVFGPAAVGRVAHLVPDEGVHAEDGGWVRVVEPARQPEARGGWERANAWVRRKTGERPGPGGTASWRIRIDAGPAARTLRVAYGGQVYELPVRVGGTRYAPPLRAFPDRGMTSLGVELRQLRLFGIVPGVPCLGIPPWLAVYLLLAIPCAALLRRALRVY